VSCPISLRVRCQKRRRRCQKRPSFVACCVACCPACCRVSGCRCPLTRACVLRGTEHCAGGFGGEYAVNGRVRAQLQGMTIIVGLFSLCQRSLLTLEHISELLHLPWLPHNASVLRRSQVDGAQEPVVDRGRGLGRARQARRHERTASSAPL